MGNGSMNMEYAAYDNHPGHYHLWKPPNAFYPGGEAPPPYEEAVANAHSETAQCTVRYERTIERKRLGYDLKVLKKNDKMTKLCNY